MKEIRFYRSPDSQLEKIEDSTNHVEQPFIQDYDQFVNAFTNANNQLVGFKDIRNDENLKEFQRHKFFHFLEYLKHQGRTFDQKLLSQRKIQTVIKEYNELLDKIIRVESVEKLAEIMKEVADFSSRTESSLYNTIDTPQKFWDTFLDYKNQFVLLQRDAATEDEKGEKMPIEKIIERNKGRTYKTFDALLEDNDKKLANVFQEEGKYQIPIHYFDDLAGQAEQFTTEEELKDILEGIDHFLHKD
ncbi:MAG: hypothetical protein V4665_02835 [Patescibacteria group bacterium]